jgi:hypothetical protein
MNPYSALISRLGLSPQSGTSMNLHWLFLLLNSLAALEDENPTASLYPDAGKEVLHRLRNQPNGFGMQEVAKLLNGA